MPLELWLAFVLASTILLTIPGPTVTLVVSQIAQTKSQVGNIGGHLWINRWGRPMHSSAIRAQIKLRTRDAFGRALWPHLFRDCAVTELVACAPGDIGIAPDLLGHADLQTTKKHYIQAQGMTAHALVQVESRRRAVTSPSDNRRTGCLTRRRSRP